MPTKTERIRALNDELRVKLNGGKVMLTQGITALADDEKAAILRRVQHFDAFDADNDPEGEHDFGIVEADGQKIIFKIDYYDRSMRLHSPDAADPALTTCVMTIMLADE